MKILVVEDDVEARTKAVRWLTALRHEPVLASSVPEVLELIKVGDVDRILITVDSKQPSTLLGEIKRHELDVPLLITSTDEHVRDLVTVVARSRAIAMPRPFHMEDLAVAIDASVTMSPPQKKLDSAAAKPAMVQSPPAAPRPAVPPTTAPAQPSVAPAQPVTAAAPRAAPVAAAPKPEAAARAAAPQQSGGVRSAVARLLNDLKDGKVKLPVLDPRIGKIQSLMARKEVELKEVVDIIGRDPTLTASVLRLANSSYFMLRTPVKDIKEACVRLGNKNVFSLAFEVMLRNQFSAHPAPFRTVMAQMWQNALVTSRFANRLAVMVRYPKPDELQAAAFLHNIGELMLIQLFSEIDDQKNAAAEDLGPEIDRLHQPLGSVLAKSWNLPPHLVRLTGHHHQAAEDPEPDDQKVPRCLILASWNLAISVGFGYLKNTEPVGLSELLATLGIDPASLEAMREEARNWVKE
jgi:HD-like signal output (HDOD) protein/CheY-like chemotaxis protein